MGILSFLNRKNASAYPELDLELWESIRFRRPGLMSLDAGDSARARRLAAWFIDRKQFVPLGGATIGEADKATIAVLACLPIVRLGERWYDDWTTVLVAPDGFIHTMSTVDDAGVVTEYEDELSGRVTELGPVLLSLPDVLESGYGDGYNVVVHEMAHKLDERDGALDGCPPLPRSMSRRAWREAFGDAFTDFQERLKRRSRTVRRRSVTKLPLDEYAAESPEEFFAVACETFFDAPGRLQQAYPVVHALLHEFFSGGRTDQRVPSG
jgi:Mlc titration factor MtfA (ptsG expression regulator)